MNDFEITREKIIIRTRRLKNGNQSIYLEMHHEGKRSTECTCTLKPTFKNEVRKFCRKRLAEKQCFALAQSNEKHTAGLP